jgi:RHS repeat-associated protein
VKRIEIKISACNIAYINLLNYRSRWYDSQLGRFISPDSIIPNSSPQSLNRYSYVNNDPINYNDPTGHYGQSACNSVPESVKASCLAGAWSYYDQLLASGYLEWEVQIMETLHTKGGSEGKSIVEYMMSTNIHITVGKKTDPQTLFDIEAWFDEKHNSVVLNPNRGYEVGNSVGNWGLQTIAHEAKHIEQGNALSHSKAGEMEAWKFGLTILSALNPGETNSGSYRDILDANDLGGFLNVLNSNPAWSGYLKGLNLYPDYPEEPWWLYTLSYLSPDLWGSYDDMYK